MGSEGVIRDGFGCIYWSYIMSQIPSGIALVKDLGDDVELPKTDNSIYIDKYGLLPSTSLDDGHDLCAHPRGLHHFGVTDVG